ncbi:MAG: helix-turn-helix domain-containing protein [Fimbriimonas sp.]
MAHTHEVTDLAQLKALSDELRQRILGAFIGEPKTTKQVAIALGEKPTKLYHHVELLSSVGLLELVETRPKRGTTEKYYKAVAHRFLVGGSAFGEGAAELDTLFSEAFRTALESIRRTTSGPAEEKKKAMLVKSELCLTQDGFARFQDELHELIHRFATEKPSDGDSYHMLAVLYRPKL